jgi:hypothetical protein
MRPLLITFYQLFQLYRALPAPATEKEEVHRLE